MRTVVPRADARVAGVPVRPVAIPPLAKLTARAVRSAAPGKHHDLHDLILRVLSA